MRKKNSKWSRWRIRGVASVIFGVEFLARVSMKFEVASCDVFGKQRRSDPQSRERLIAPAGMCLPFAPIN